MSGDRSAPSATVDADKPFAQIPAEVADVALRAIAESTKETSLARIAPGKSLASVAVPAVAFSRESAMRLRARSRQAIRLLRGASRKNLDLSLSAFEGMLDGYGPAPKLVSIDCFDTLLLRDSGTRDFEAAPSPAYRRVVRKLTAEARARGDDPEISLAAIYENLMPTAPPSNSLVQHLADGVDHEYRRTSASPTIQRLIRKAFAANIPVVVTTDTRFSSTEIRELLARHDVEHIDRIYASSEYREGKFSGRIYDRLCRDYAVDAKDVVHIGDNRLVDQYSARERGLLTVRFHETDLRQRFGYEVLGPILAGFAHLLLSESARQGLERLLFVARDAELLQTIATLFRDALPAETPSLTYLALSRRTTSLPATAILDAQALAKVAHIRAGGSLFDRFCGFFGLKRDLFTDALARFGAEPSDDVPIAIIHRLLDDPEVQAIIDLERRLQRDRLERYLRQVGMFGSSRVALVDCGWNATTQRALSKTFADAMQFSGLGGFYIGYGDDWSDNAKLSEQPNAVGLLGDLRRGRNLLEAAFSLLTHPIEAVCRAPHGTTIGYEDDGHGGVTPIFAPPSERKAEVLMEEWRDPIRNGIARYAARYASEVYRSTADLTPQQVKRLRRLAQWRAVRLALFPKRWEVDSVANLVVTEGHAPGWSDSIISRDRPHPFLEPRRWLVGLSSPWRTGYVAVTGGPMLAIAYGCVEAVLIALGPVFRERLRTVALTLAARSSGAGSPPSAASALVNHERTV